MCARNMLDYPTLDARRHWRKENKISMISILRRLHEAVQKYAKQLEKLNKQIIIKMICTKIDQSSKNNAN